MSIQEIAKDAKVSIATVSRYINGNGKVADETAKRIAAAMKKINYKPRICRPGRKTRDRIGIKTGNILFLTLGDMGRYTVMRQSVYASVLNGTQKFVQENNLNLSYAHSSGKSSDIPEALEREKCDGVIAFGRNYTLSKELKKYLLKVPTVWCFGIRLDDTLAEFDQIAYNNSLVGQIAASHLSAKGCQKVAYLSNQKNNSVYIERWKAFEQYCNNNGMTSELIAYADTHTFEQEIKKIRPEDFQYDGIAFSNDNIMLMTYCQMRFCGVDTSKIQMIGCDNQCPLSELFNNSPATIDVRIEEVGYHGAEILLQRINKKNQGKRHHEQLDPTLVHNFKSDLSQTELEVILPH